MFSDNTPGCRGEGCLVFGTGFYSRQFAWRSQGKIERGGSRGTEPIVFTAPARLLVL